MKPEENCLEQLPKDILTPHMSRSHSRRGIPTDWDKRYHPSSNACHTHAERRPEYVYEPELDMLQTVPGYVKHAEYL